MQAERTLKGPSAQRSRTVVKEHEQFWRKNILKVNSLPACNAL